MRIIPAYAGQIFCSVLYKLLHRDHPRIRGTNATHKIYHTIRQGSSPHTRDKFKTVDDNAPEHRIIPAYAGQITPYRRFKIQTKDHPRIRGTNFLFRKSGLYSLGSSPHTRDKFLLIQEKLVLHRIIPAYAGQIHKLNVIE